MDALYLWVMAGLLLVSVAILFVPVTPAAIELTPTELGYLRRGTKGAVLTALTALHADGLIEVRARGGVRRTIKPYPSGGDPFQRAVYGALHVPAGPRTLAARPAVRRARAGVVDRLAGAGLVPGRFRMVVGRTMLVAVAVLAAIRLGTGSGWATLVTAAAVLVALCLWLLSQCTIAGHGVLRAMRREHTRRLADWTATEHNPHDPALDAPLRQGVPPAAAPGSLLTIGVALGLVVSLVAAGIQVVDFGGDGSDDGFDGGGSGDQGLDDRVYGAP